ncbi:MAG: PH domain-containing protein [Candidatus Kaiserbacteria bacterium]|nr:PH domain-containing protein [Candidatus Kaiserbacteria bacterium]
MKTEKIQLEEDEVVLLQVRKHWFVLCIQFFFVLALAIFPGVFLFLTQTSSSIAKALPFNGSIVTALYAGWLIIMWMVLFSIWTNYYLDVWTVTNKRLIAVDQRGFFSRVIASFRLERMQDISISVHGIIATFLDFGTLEIQTAGEEGNFKVTGIPGPADIKAVILSSSDALIPSIQKASERAL